MQFFGIRQFWTVQYFILLIFLCQGSNSTPDESAVQSISGHNDHSVRKFSLPVEIDYVQLLEEKSHAPVDQTETSLQTREFSRFGRSRRKQEPAKEQEPQYPPDNTEDKSDSAETAPPQWFDRWPQESLRPSAQTRGIQSRDIPSVSSREIKSPETREVQSSGGWFSSWSAPAEAPKPEEQPKVASKAAGGSWLGGLWGSSPADVSSDNTPEETPEPESAPPKTGGLFSGWFSGSPSQEAPTEGKKGKQHGPLRQLVKTVEHTIYPKVLRQAIKNVPGVYATRRALKSTLDTIDSIGDSEYVTNIRNAAVESSGRVGTKALNLADSVLELGTGTSEATINMVDTLQKEGARTLDTVSIACPPAKPAVEFVTAKVDDGVLFLHNGNDKIRKGGKDLLSRVVSFAKKITPGKKKEEEKPPAPSSWW